MRIGYLCEFCENFFGRKILELFMHDNIKSNNLNHQNIPKKWSYLIQNVRLDLKFTLDTILLHLHKFI